MSAAHEITPLRIFHAAGFLRCSDEGRRILVREPAPSHQINYESVRGAAPAMPTMNQDRYGRREQTRARARAGIQGFLNSIGDLSPERQDYRRMVVVDSVREAPLIDNRGDMRHQVSTAVVAEIDYAITVLEGTNARIT